MSKQQRHTHSASAWKRSGSRKSARLLRERTASDRLQTRVQLRAVRLARTV